MLKNIMAHGQTPSVFGKLMAGISLAVFLTGCGKINQANPSQSNQANPPQTTKVWTTKKVTDTKAKTISDWINKPGNRTKVNVYSSIPDVAGVVATANMKSGYANRVYKYTSPAILDNYYFSYISTAGTKTKPSNKQQHVVFKSANIDGVQISKDSGSFHNAVIYVSKNMIAKENKLAEKTFSESKSMMAKEKSSEKKSKEKNKTNAFDTYNETNTDDLNAYSKYRDNIYKTLLKALGVAASNTKYKRATVQP